MGKKVMVFSILCFLTAMPLMARAASIRKGILLEMKGGYYRCSDVDMWEEAIGHSFSAFGGLKLSREILENIELGVSADYLRANQYEWAIYLVPIGLTVTYALRRRQDQGFVPYLGLGGDFVYGKTGTMERSDDPPYYLKEPGFHATAGVRILLDAATAEDASTFDQKYGVNNSYLVFEAKYFQLFNADYADEEPPKGEKETGYLDPKGVFVSVGILVEF